MSYILDALRKADSDRERGAVPGIHAQTLPPLGGADEGRRAPGLLLWAVIALALLLAALVAWQFIGSDDTPEPEPVQAAAPLPLPLPLPAPAPIAAAPPPAPAPRVEPPIASTLTLPRIPADAAPRPAVSAAKAAPAASAASAAAATRIHAQSELPDTIRRELPQIVVGGSIYSDNPANRFLVINGQVFHEGDKLGPELWLDQIKLKAAVLRFKGYRYGITY